MSLLLLHAFAYSFASKKFEGFTANLSGILRVSLKLKQENCQAGKGAVNLCKTATGIKLSIYAAW